ncbi:phosphonate metabolism protein/1,5-bisphosphokinase (PRPP-forming) PhnN [Paraburkholderia aspalathi]|uniref:phosphonate metabolism protein/1,5-bisphosphokinase (PRPP-forming) PhnN n=1 Tax=Paraburkholderia aspalathi TaxID=1324617 RepID=UPI001ABFB0BD|nr:phosphonate metabolism protein/1,5-bisphosphokinase (PRPP-forming) PhnN [Paraburkholderia aspalathi]
MINLDHSGRFVVIVGPSGAGKDTLIDYAREHLADDNTIHFVRRVITRPVSVGEDHDPVTSDMFEERVGRAAFALHWDAHGLRYGLPGIIDDWLEQRHVVVANGSRAVLPEARRRYGSLLRVINVSASPNVLAERLEKRGREGYDGRRARIARTAQIHVDLSDALDIDNSGELSIAGQALVTVLRRVTQLRGQSQSKG